MKNCKFEAPKVSDLPLNYDLGKLVAFNALSKSEVLLLFAENDLNYRNNTMVGSSPKTKTEEGQNYTAFLSADGQLTRVLSVENEAFNIHGIQLLPSNRFLLVCARSQYRSATDYDKNGRIYDANGNLLGAILLGDGIEDVQVSKNGDIWISYFDEGVFGNNGWHDPVGSCGLKLWKESGEPIYDYFPPEELDWICDCYAMNVESDHITWAYYYSDFPLVKIKDRIVVDYWHIPIAGSDCFAIFRNHAVFRGEYNNRDLFFVVKLLPKHEVEVVKKVTVTNVDTIIRVTCRDESIFLLSNQGVFRISAWELLSDCG